MVDALNAIPIDYVTFGNRTFLQGLTNRLRLTNRLADCLTDELFDWLIILPTRTT